MYKIILSPSKSQTETKPWTEGERPVYLEEARNIFKDIKALSLEETKEVYNLSDKLADKVYKMHQEHGSQYFRAIDMFDGLVFKQLEIDKYDLEWINKHVVILDALYGIVRPLDLLSTYRLDFNNKMMTKEHRAVWKEKFNEYFKDHEIINFASEEFSSLIDKEMIQPKMDESIKQIKVRRGQALNKLLINKTFK